MRGLPDLRHRATARERVPVCRLRRENLRGVGVKKTTAFRFPFSGFRNPGLFSAPGAGLDLAENRKRKTETVS